MNHLHCFDIAWIEQPLLSCEKHFACTDMLLIDAKTFLHSKAYRFLTKNMLPRIESIQHYLTVEIKRSGHQYRINSLIFQDFPIICIYLGFPNQIQCFFHRRLIYVAQCNNLHLRILQQKTHQETSP